MEQLLNLFNKEILVSLVTALLVGIIFFVSRYLKDQKEIDDELLKAINGLGGRVNREISFLKNDIQDANKEFKKDFIRLESKLDHTLEVINDIEKRIIILSNEFEIKILKEERKKERET